MASSQAQKPTATTIEVCQPKSQHSSFGQKISEITNKAFKGHHARHGSNQNQLQSYSQSQVESHGQNGSKTETRCYGQTQTQHDKKHGVSKTQITVCVVQAQITQTNEEYTSPYGTATTCFGNHGRKNRELNNKKDMNLFRRIKNGISRHGNEGNSSSSESESDDEKRPKTKASDEKCQKTTKTSDEKCQKTTKASDEKCPKAKN